MNSLRKSIRRLPLVIAGLTLAIGALTIHAQDDAAVLELPSGVSHHATVEGISEYRLDNGLRFLLFPDQSKDQITLNITYLVGSHHENYGETGMAHLLEHLIFKGTPNHPNITKELTDRGAIPNGTTWFDRTNYFETLPATEDNLAWAIDLEADRMVNSFVSAEDLESEMTVVRNEFQRGENNSIRMLTQRVLSSAYLWHNYGKPTIGALSDIENMPIERLQAFYKKYYQPDNAVLIIAGRFDPKLAIELVSEKFGAIPRPDRTGANRIYGNYTVEPAQDGERTVRLRRTGDLQMIMAAYHIPAGSAEDYAAVSVLTHILGAQPSGRLYTNVVKTGLAAWSTVSRYQLEHPGVLFARMGIRIGDPIQPAEDALKATFQELVDEPPTQQELDRAKNEFRNSFETSMLDPQAFTRSLSNWVSRGDWRLFFLHRDRVALVTAEDVQTAAMTYLIDSNRTIGYFLPLTEPPQRADTGGIPNVAAMVENYKGGEAIAQGEAFDPSLENIEARTTRVSLSSGVKVALLPKKSRGNLVRLTIQFNHGTEQSLSGQAAAASIAGAMLMRGSANFSRQELQDELTRLRIEGNAFGGLTAAGANFTTIRENLPAAIRLASELLRSPRFDEAEFKMLVESDLADIENGKSDPQSLATEAINRHLNPYAEGHPHYVSTAEEEIDALRNLTLDDVKEFWKEFYGASQGQIAVVGDFDTNEIVPILEDAFQGWSSPSDYEHVYNRHFDQDSLNLDINTPDKANAIMYAGLTLPFNDAHEDYPAMAIAMHIMGGGFLSSRLAVRIRQNEGLSYGIRASLTTGTPDERSMILGYAIFAPEHKDRVKNAYREEFEKALSLGFTEAEVEAAKAGYLDSAQNRRSTDNSIASALRSSLRLDRTMKWSADFERNVQDLTTQQVNDAFRRHVDLKNMTFVRAGDFEKVAEAAMSDSASY